MESADEHQILALFEDGDRALMSADIDGLSRIFADDYVQYNESGRAFTKHDVLENLKSGRIRYISMVSTGRQIRVFGDFAMVHGSEEDEVEQGGKRFSVRYVYTDVVIQRNGKWQIVGSQLAKPA
jgi:ketosteroid isomerase-like protein